MDGDYCLLQHLLCKGLPLIMSGCTHYCAVQNQDFISRKFKYCLEGASATAPVIYPVVNYLTGKCLHVTSCLDAPIPKLFSLVAPVCQVVMDSHLFSSLHIKTEWLQPSHLTMIFHFASSHVSPCLRVALLSFFSRLAPIYQYPFPVLVPEKHSAFQYCQYHCYT